jgi:acetyl-CoA C-acetyltransferase
MQQAGLSGRTVYLVDGARTPFLKSKNKPGKFAASDMAVAAAREILLRQDFSTDALDELVLGCMMPSEDEANIGRVVALRLGCPNSMPAWTVQRNCASGMQALDSAIKDIACGRHNLVLAGGAETMSRAPLILRPQMAAWLTDWSKARTVGAKARQLTKLRLANFAPIIALLRGLTDPIVGMTMPATAEMVAHKFGITRKMMDEYALRSHKLSAAAQAGGYLDEIVSIIDAKGTVYSKDNGVRADTTLSQIEKVRGLLDKRFGLVSAANSSQVTDGAAMLLLASEDAVQQHALQPIAKITDVQWSALEPEIMGLGPVLASGEILKRNNLATSDIDFWEINEAFAGQVLGCQAAWSDEDFCQQYLSSPAMPAIPEECLNIDGGAVAVGHPVGASGARIVHHLAKILQRKSAARGIASICIGGGQGGAMLIEKV